MKLSLASFLLYTLYIARKRNLLNTTFYVYETYPHQIIQAFWVAAGYLGGASSAEARLRMSHGKKLRIEKIAKAKFT